MSVRLPYTLLWFIALPFVLLRLLWRARRQPEYLHHLGERLGRFPARDPAPMIWIHAVSVGETRAAEPLVRALLARWPDHRILLTHMTPTGRATAAALFGDEARVQSAYLPYDLGPLARRFLRHYRPRFGVIMETELWPNLLAACAQAQVPVMLANARLSARSAGRYARWPSLARATLGALAAVGAQTDADCSRLAALGAARPSRTGNIKFDIAPPAPMLARAQAFRDRIGKRPVLLAASTREGEEAGLLAAFARQAPPEVLLLLVPRHPQRFDEVAALVATHALPLQRRSADEAVAAATRVWLGDSMGEMFAYYGAADAALIGGSWLPFGGQNLIESCAVGTPVILGPHTFNFELVAEQAIEAGAALRASDIEAGVSEGLALLQDPARRVRMGEAGSRFALSHRGATERTLAVLDSLLKASPAAH